MLETLISSRVRRALFGHILLHPTDRFYLRGLAKELGVTVSPLRREIKRLERDGILQPVPEGRMLFYTVKTASPKFLALQQAFHPAEAPMGAHQPSAPPQATIQVAPPAPAMEPLRQGAGVLAAPTGGPRLDPTSTCLHAVSGFLHWQRRLSAPALIGVTAMGMGLMLVVVSESYTTMLAQESGFAYRGAVNSRRDAPGVMRSGQWQVTSAGMSGLRSSAHDERREGGGK